MRIVKLKAENFKRLSAIEITPEGDIIEIRGKNAAGKSSVLDAIWCAVGGGDVLPTRPIRRGAETARIELDLGELIITRRFTPNGSTVVVEAASGARFRAPQHMLDELIGAIAFDPLAFTRMEPVKQLDALRRLVKLEVDIDAIDGLNARDYEKRTEVNRDAKRVRGQASGIQYPEDLPPAPVDIAALTERLRQAGEDNTTIERRKARRQAAVAEAALGRRTAEQRRERADQLRREAEDLERAAAEAEARAAQIDREIAEAPPLPEPVDTAELVAALDAAHSTNMALDAKARRETLEAEATALEERSAALTTAMAERTAVKTAAIANAVMPVAGLGFGDGEVLFNDLPLDQASQAEKIRVSVAIAMSANPKMRVLAIRDGSVLDDDSLKIISEMANEEDYQIWLEIVGEGKTGVLIEDGSVKYAAAAGPEARAMAEQGALI
jgi:hypothetical protein